MPATVVAAVQGDERRMRHFCFEAEMTADVPVEPPAELKNVRFLDVGLVREFKNGTNLETRRPFLRASSRRPQKKSAQENGNADERAMI
jgi:hypothetical protein